METKILPSLVQTVAEALYRRLKDGGNFGFPTGRTMDPIYARLVELHQAAPVNPGKIHAFMVDEYSGLSPQDSRSYTAYLTQRVFAPLGITQVHTITEIGYEDQIKKVGGLDLQLLGLGPNGHIGFNEPGSTKQSRTRLVEIAEATREANSSLFASKSDVPTHAISIGVATILEAREVWVIASGASKAAIVAKLKKSAETSELPASFLKSHSNCTLFLDSTAAELVQ